MPNAPKATVERKEDENGEVVQSLEDELRSRSSFLALAQRKTEIVNKDILHPLVHRVFGTPLLLRVTDMDQMTGRQIYDLVAMHLRNFVPASALKFLQDDSTPDAEMTDSTSEEEKDERTKFEIRQQLPRTMSDMEEVAAGHVPRYGFRLRLTTRDGRRCAISPWYECSIGCLVPDDDKPTVVMNGDSIAIDWHFAVDVATNGFGGRSNKGDAVSQRVRMPGVSIKNHPSCGIGKKNSEVGAITLENCLDAFAKEEKIPEAYCSNCQDHRVQTKRMSLWRLPPVVIIHLKRFQFTEHMRRKLRDFVEFPVEGLDLSRIMAPDTASKKDETPKPETNGDAKSEPSEPEPGEDEDAAIDENEENQDSSRLKENDGRSEMLYDLYGVVHHQGALSGGHYVASLKSEIDGQWRLFNDAQVYEIHSRDVVDSSAYILFYIRRDVKDLKLEDFWDTAPAQEGEGLTEEEMDKLIRDRSDRCTIS